MKKLAIYFTMAFLALSFSACEEDSDSKPDLTKDVVGSYSGYLMLETSDNTSMLEDLNVKITKKSNTQVTIAPDGQTATHTFVADLEEASDGVAFNIKEQSVPGGNLWGYVQENSTEDIHGGVAPEETEQNFFYTVKVDLSGWSETRVFIGSKVQ